VARARLSPVTIRSGSRSTFAVRAPRATVGVSPNTIRADRSRLICFDDLAVQA